MSDRGAKTSARGEVKFAESVISENNPESKGSQQVKKAQPKTLEEHEREINTKFLKKLKQSLSMTTNEYNKNVR